MATRWLLFAILMVFFVETRDCAKSAFRAYSFYNDYGKDDNKTFIVPISKLDNMSVYCQYKKEKMAFVILKIEVNHYAGDVLCSQKNARLAVIDNMEKANFTAKCLAALDFKVDSLWVGATLNDYSGWVWRKDDDDSVPITDDILKQFSINKNVQADDRKCLTFDRKNHEGVQFQPIRCNVLRYILCDTKNKATADDDEIVIGKNSYIIVDKKVSYETAKEKCILDYQRNLAALDNYPHSQELGRYLLVHREKIENAWIGAAYSYEKKAFVFEDSQDVLDNVTNEQGYPPWINNTVQKAGGCILLDHHISNISYFVPDFCDRSRPFICSKSLQRNILPDNTTEDCTDVIVGDYGYRLCHYPENWHNVSYICKIVYKEYNGTLVEIREKEQVDHLLYVMGGTEIAVQHIWIGGRLDEQRSPPVWIWDSDGKPIATGVESRLNWVINTTYEDSVENINTCLNMDRENVRVPFFYGTNCMAHQKFVCLFTAENLRRLRRDENKDDDLD